MEKDAARWRNHPSSSCFFERATSPKALFFRDFGEV